MEKISVIVPCYNTEKYLEECILSIINQTYSNLEIIIVNDGSTDHSFEIMKKYQNKDHRIQIISQENQGLLHARKSGVIAASSKYIVFVDADDYIFPDEIQNAFSVLKKYNADIVKFRFQFVPEKRDSKFYFNKENDSIFDTKNKKDFYYEFINTNNLNNIWSQLFKKDLYDVNSNIFSSRTNLGEDVIQNVMLYQNASKIVTTSFIGYAYRFNPNSITKKRSVSQSFSNLNDLKKNIQYLDEFIRVNKLQSSQHEFAKKMFYKVIEEIQNLMLYTDISKTEFVHSIKSYFNDQCFSELINWLDVFNCKRSKDIYLKYIIEKKYDKIYSRRWITYLEKIIKKVSGKK